MRILTGDIGGTNSRLAVATSIEGRLELSHERRYPSMEHHSLQDILEHYLAHLGEPMGGAALGLPGPVANGHCDVTNLPWVVDARTLEADTGISRIVLLNDLEAAAWGIDSLSKEALFVLQPGASGSQGNRSVIAAGTGLGEAGMYWDGSRHHPFATEGGHASFAPRSDLEVDLLRWLEPRYGQVSWERLVSGPGLVHIFEFLSRHRGIAQPAGLQQAMKHGDPAAAIAQAANNHESPTCIEAMELFCSLYGAEAGNQALKLMATGGVYVGGGIAPKILAWLQRPAFLEAFRDKGKMQGLMEKIPVSIILDDRTALYGPARKWFAESAPDH